MVWSDPGHANVVAAAVDVADEEDEVVLLADVVLAATLDDDDEEEPDPPLLLSWERLNRFPAPQFCVTSPGQAKLQSLVAACVLLPLRVLPQ